MYEDLKKAIEELRDIYLSSGTVHSYQEINCGYCPEFADEIICNYLKECKDIRMITTDYFKNDNDSGKSVWDLNILKNEYKSFLPQEILWNELNNVQLGFHVWIYHNGKHFDAECSEGVANLFDLPFFKRDLNNYIKKH